MMIKDINVDSGTSSPACTKPNVVRCNYELKKYLSNYKNSKMSNKDLLQPRWKVIADFPNSDYKLWQILDRDWSRYINDDESGGVIWKISDFPHLFIKLKWWEERNINEMPKSVKLIGYKESYGDLKIGSIREVSEWVSTKNGKGWLCDSFPVYLKIEDVEPVGSLRK